MLHFAQTAIALVAGGASILIIGGLVRETLHNKGRHFHLIPDAHDRPELRVADGGETEVRRVADPILEPRSEKTHGERKRRNRTDNNEARQQRRKAQRRNKKRDRRRQRAETAKSTNSVQAEDA